MNKIIREILSDSYSIYEENNTWIYNNENNEKIELSDEELNNYVDYINDNMADFQGENTSNEEVSMSKKELKMAKKEAKLEAKMVKKEAKLEAKMAKKEAKILKQEGKDAIRFGNNDDFENFTNEENLVQDNNSYEEQPVEEIIEVTPEYPHIPEAQVVENVESNYYENPQQNYYENNQYNNMYDSNGNFITKPVGGVITHNNRDMIQKLLESDNGEVTNSIISNISLTQTYIATLKKLVADVKL